MNKGVEICGHLFGKSVRYMCFEKKKEIFKNRKQNFPAHTDYLFIFFYTA